MEYKFPIKITKDLIESKVDQETLMATYYGVPIRKGLFKSTMRADNRPTVAYYKNKNNRLIVKDFGSDYCGDWIYVVMHKFQCSYQGALNIAANDFGIQKFPKLEKNPIIIDNEKLDVITDSIVQVEIKDFNEYELKWWSKYYIDIDTLKKYKVYSCKNVFLNSKLFHLYKDKQLIFGYFGGIREGLERWKIYFPGRRRGKFISNWKSSMIQGINMIPKYGEYLVITKSLKDCMVFYKLNIPAIAPMSENCFLSESQYNKLKLRFNNIILLYDNDRAGLRSMVKFKKQFPDIIPIWIPWKYKAKDISDFICKYKIDKTIELIESAKKYVQEYKK